MVSCNKKNEPEQLPIEKIEILTHQNSYQQTDEIAFKIVNNTSEEIFYYACKYQTSPSVNIQKQNQMTWEVVRFTPCLEFAFIPIQINEIKKDTVSPILNENGIYRLEIRIIVNQEDTSIYSNNFEIID